jgi:hypothetical protein
VRGLVLAAATVGILNGLVRTADATGSPLDEGTWTASVRFREELGLNEFSGAASSLVDRSACEPEGESGKSAPSKLFDFE